MADRGEQIRSEYRNEFNEFFKLVEKRNKIPNEFYESYNVKRGLRNSDGTGVLVGLTVIGEVHGYVIEDNDRIPAHGRLMYRGIDVRELVGGCSEEGRFGFDEVCYLILLGSLPNKVQLDSFNKIMVRLRELPDQFVEDMILKAPSPDIMNKLARAVLALYSYDETPDSLNVGNILLQSMSLIARFPLLVAYAYAAKCHYYGNKSLVLHSPNSNLTTAENFLYMIRPDNCYTKLEADILDLALVLHAEHGGGNNSAFATHVVSSSGTDTYSAISAAVGSLKGPKHGGASSMVAAMFEDIKLHVSDITDEAQVSKYLIKIINKEAFDKTGLVYGMGHAVYTLSDPRAIILKEKAKELAESKGMLDEFKLYEIVEAITPEIFAKHKKNSKVISANVDFYSGFVYKMLGLPPELYTPIFAMSRIVGWCAHRIEEIVSGGRIIRPAYKSVSKRSHYIPLDKR